MFQLLAQTTSDQTLWMPRGASHFAPSVDNLFYFILWVSIICFVGIGGSMFWFAWKYRQKDRKHVPHGSHHNNTLEITWSVIPLIIVLVIFIWGFRGFLDMSTPPGQSYEIYVDAQKWAWNFTYPEGASSSILHVPADTPINLILRSRDVIHSLYIPVFRQKKDVVPGRYNKFWFQTPWDPALAKMQDYPVPGAGYDTEALGDVKFDHPTIVYDLYCTEYCGTRHSWMWSKVVVHPKDKWPDVVAKLNILPDDPVDAGRVLYTRKGCNACHSVDGSQGIGPTFKDLFGRQEQTSAGTVQVDENYIHESIVNPGKQIVNGFANQMPPFILKDEEIGFLIAYLKSISTHAGGAATVTQPQPGSVPTKEEAHGDTAPGDQGIDPRTPNQ